MGEEEDAATAAAKVKAVADAAAAAAAAADPTEQKESTNLIEKANLAALRQEEANKKLEELLNRQEQMKVEKTLGGTTEAGHQEQTKEEKDIEGAKSLLKGSGMEEMAFPPEKKQ